MKQINRFLIMLTLLCILGLAGSGVAAAADFTLDLDLLSDLNDYVLEYDSVAEELTLDSISWNSFNHAADRLILTGELNGTLTIAGNIPFGDPTAVINIILDNATITQPTGNSLDGALILIYGGGGSGQLHHYFHLSDSSVNTFTGADGLPGSGATTSGKAGISTGITHIYGDTGQLIATGGNGASNAGGGAGIGSPGGYYTGINGNARFAGSIGIFGGVIKAAGGNGDGLGGHGRDIGGGGAGGRSTGSGFRGGEGTVSIFDGIVIAVHNGIGGGFASDSSDSNGGRGGDAYIYIMGGLIFTDTSDPDKHPVIGGGNGGSTLNPSSSGGNGGYGEVTMHDPHSNPEIYVLNAGVSNVNDVVYAGFGGDAPATPGNDGIFYDGELDYSTLTLVPGVPKATFHANGGSWTSLTKQEIPIDLATPALFLQWGSNPDLDPADTTATDQLIGPSGSTFLGWFKAADVSEIGSTGIYAFDDYLFDDTQGVSKTESISLLNNYEFYAVWGYEIKLDPNDGEFSDSVATPKYLYAQYGQSLSDIAGYEHFEDLEYGLWDFDGWVNNLYVDYDLTSTTPISSNLDLFAKWVGTVTLDANGGAFGSLGSTVPIEVQPGQTYSNLVSLINIELAGEIPVNGAWNYGVWDEDTWYIAAPGGIVDAVDLLDLSGSTNPVETLFAPSTSGGTLYVGWFNDIFLDANGGEFGSGSSVFRIPIEVQFGQTYGDLVPLIAAELAGNAPEYGRLIPKMWYLTQISGNVPYVDTSSFLDLTDPATLSILADGNEIFFVGWSQPSSNGSGSGTGGATIVGGNQTGTNQVNVTPQESGSSSGSNGSNDLPPTLVVEDPPTAERNNTWLYIILFLILLLIAICIGYYYYKKQKNE